MSYQGGPVPGNGFWQGHGPPNGYGVAQNTRPPNVPNLPSPHPTTNGTHQWDQNGQRQHGMAENGHKDYNQPVAIQPQSQQPQYINPAQMFQQPPAHTPHLQPTSLNHKLSTPTFKSTPRMATAPTNSQADRAMLLISLAEEFFDAAHNMAPSVSVSMTLTNVCTYERLIATGLSCLETALEHKGVKMSPRLEANVRLRYAGVLYEETENTSEAETALSKGIAVCENNHYFDLKYAMHYLLAKLVAKKNPKAAMKALDGLISEAEVYHHYSWAYALRFLRASYALESGTLTESHAAIQNLQKVGELATKQGDRAIHLTASLMEAMAHLKSTGPDSIEHVQRAIAAARIHQFDVGNSILQLTGLTHIIDVICSIRQGNSHQMLNKLKDMQAMMDEALKDGRWDSASDIIAIPINRTPKASQTVSHETRMVLGIGEDGRDNLMMSFLSKRDAYSINYLLCGVILLYKNPNDDKAIKYLNQGLSSLAGDTQVARATSGLLPDLAAKQQWRGHTMCYFRLYLAFEAANHANWPGVKRNIDELKSTARKFEIPLVGHLECLAVYLTGVYYQGTGDLDEALRIFQDQKFNLSLPKLSNPTSGDQIERDFALLAALNTLWILQDEQRQNLGSNAAMLATLEPLCSKHPNRDIQTAFNLAMATVSVNPPAPLLTVKKYLGLALQGAQLTANTQFLCITLSVMCSRFFANVVGEQAEKSAMAASIQAQKSGSNLWRSVAKGMLARCYEVQGRNMEAQATLEQARELAQMAMPNE